MQFKVPQDVQREDTIIGPLTLRQMIILGIGGGIAYSIYVTLAKTYFLEVWLPPVSIVVVITAAFAFLKIHNLPFHQFLMNFIEYHVIPKKRIWIQGAGKPYISALGTLNKKKTTAQKEDVKETKKAKMEAVRKVLESEQEKHNALKNFINNKEQ